MKQEIDKEVYFERYLQSKQQRREIIKNLYDTSSVAEIYHHIMFGITETEIDVFED
jgi:hypothetical protein